MGARTLWRLGYCWRGNGAMQKLDPAFLFELGDSMRAIGRIAPDQNKWDIYFALNSAKSSIQMCVYQSVYASHFHGPLFVAVNNLVATIDELMARMVPGDGSDGQDLHQWDVMGLHTLY